MQTDFTTRDGTPWQPMYLDSIDQETCIGCGRCIKVCGHGVMEMKYMSEDGELLDGDDGDAERMVMTVAAAGQCIGCGACSRVCSKKAQTLVAA